MAFRKYVQQNHDVGFHRHASNTNSEKLHRVKDRRSRALSNALSYSTQGSEPVYGAAIGVTRERRQRIRGTQAGAGPAVDDPGIAGPRCWTSLAWLAITSPSPVSR